MLNFVSLSLLIKMFEPDSLLLDSSNPVTRGILLDVKICQKVRVTWDGMVLVQNNKS